MYKQEHIRRTHHGESLAYPEVKHKPQDHLEVIKHHVLVLFVFFVKEWYSMASYNYCKVSQLKG